MVSVSLQLPIIFGLLAHSAFSWSIFDRFPKQIVSENPCIGLQNGTLVEHLLDCHYYWQCGQAGSATLQKCPAGYTFGNGTCTRSNRPCSLNPKACQGLKVDSYLPNLSNCQKLWVCAAEGPLAASCPFNSTFDPNYGLCLSSSQCSGDVCVGFQFDAQVPVQGDCTNYWQCSVNGTSSKSCTEGYSFNPLELECQPSQVANCPPYVPFQANCSNVSPGSMIPGEYCDQFYICNGDEPIKFVCDNYKIYNSDRGYCVSNETDYVCKTPLNPCKDLDIGSRVPVNGSSTSYLLCLENGPVRLNCPPGFEFSLTDLQCVSATVLSTITPSTIPVTGTRTTETTEKLTTVTTLSPVDLEQMCSENPRATFLPYPGNCSLFIICVRNGQSIGYCQEGEHFNGLDNCVSPAEAQCDPAYTTVPTTVTGSVSTAPTTLETTPTGSAGSSIPTTQTTLPPTGSAGSSIPTIRATTPTGSAGSSIPTAPTTLETIPTVSVTNPGSSVSTAPPTTEELTIVSTLSPVDLEQMCSENPGTTFLPYPGNCSQFIICIINAQSIGSCQEGEHFNGVGNCVSPEEAQCDPAYTTVPTTVTGSVSTAPTAPTTPTSAPPTPTITPNTQQSTQEILQKACENQPLGAKVNYPGSCSLYIECSNPPTYKDCNSDYFSSATQTCGLFQNSECALKDIACANGVKVGKDPSNCNGYVICTSNQPLFIHCNNGEGFDPVKGCAEDSSCQTRNSFWNFIFNH